MKDYYRVLGLEERASQGEIKRTFRRLALKYHPDRNPGDTEAEERFKEVVEAYHILGNPEKRVLYDRLRKQGIFKGMRNVGVVTYAFPISYIVFSSLGEARVRSTLGLFKIALKGVLKALFSRDLVLPLIFRSEDLKGGLVTLDLSGLSKGEVLRVRIPSDVGPGTRLKLRGKGRKVLFLPRGDLYLEIWPIGGP